MKHSLSILLFYLFSMVLNFSVYGTNRYVSEGGTGDGLSWATSMGSIQSAVWDSEAGDTIFVSAGIYHESVAIESGVHILGGYNAETGDRNIEAFATILDGTGLGSWLLVKYDSPAEQETLIDGFTLQNAEHSNEGGAAYLRDNITLSNCYITNCKGSNGGGVFLSGGGQVINTTIELCEATSSGGAIRNRGGLVENCILRGNQGKYGTIRNEDGGIVRNTIIYNNSASVPGWPNSGGIYNPSGSVINCIIASNYGAEYAAIHSDGEVINTIFWNNKADDGFNDPLAYISSGSGSFNNAGVDGSALAVDAFALNANNTDANGPNFKSPTQFQGVPTSPEEIAAMRAADWSFTENSPLIDKGVDTDISYDITGTSRPLGAGYDLGAYEYNPDMQHVPVESVSITSESLTIEEEEGQWLSVIIQPIDATNKQVTWSSSDEAVATVEGGYVKGIAPGTATISVTTVDGGKTATCVVEVIEMVIPVYHPDVVAADQLDESAYTVPSFTKMIIAREAARNDSSEVNLIALSNAVENLVDKKMPYTVVATINGDPTSRMGFAWFTNAGIMSGKVQLVALADATEEDFNNETLDFEAEQTELNDLNYSVYGNKLPIPANSKRSYVSHKALATGLAPNTTYSYRVGSDGAWSDIQSFKTANNNKDPFTFLYMADPQVLDDVYMATTHRASQAAANYTNDAGFLLVPGDFVETGTALNSEWEWEQLLDYAMKPVLEKLTLVPTDGNHDDSPNLNYTYHFNADASFNETAATLPQFEGINYSFVYGDALFIIFSFQDYWRSGYMESLMEWFEAQVEAHPDTKWRIISAHKNLFTGSGHQPDSDSKLFREKMLPLIDDLEIDFFIQGHDHVYEVIGPVDSETMTVIPGSVSEVATVDAVPEINVTGYEGGVFDVTYGPLYFINGTAGEKRYYPYTKEEMEEDYELHEVENYWDLFTGKFGQPGEPTFSEISVSTESIVVKTYTVNNNSEASLYDEFTLVKGEREEEEDVVTGMKSESFLLYPNPASHALTVSTTGITGVSAVDSSGRTFDLPFRNQVIDISKLKDGYYVIRIFSGNKTENVNILKRTN